MKKWVETSLTALVFAILLGDLVVDFIREVIRNVVDDHPIYSVVGPFALGLLLGVWLS